MIEFINFIAPNASGLAWLVKQIIEGVSSVAVGIILFTLILKAITLPFDFVSRYQMRKNSVKMEQMRPELEKLQKQYADNKTLYNQKMMALYKKNGYSMWGACLPTLITLAIFIVAINGFNGYSQYKNKEYFYNMSNSYNAVFYSGMEIDNNYTKLDSTGKVVVDYEKLFDGNVKNPIVSQVYESELKDKYYVRTIEENGNYSQIQAFIDTNNQYTFELVDNQTISKSMMTADGKYIVEKDGNLNASSLNIEKIIEKAKTLDMTELSDFRTFDNGLNYKVEKTSGTDFYLCLYSTNESDTCYVKILLKQTVEYNNSYYFALKNNKEIKEGMIVDGTVVKKNSADIISINPEEAKKRVSLEIPNSPYTIKTIMKTGETYLDLHSTNSFINIETKYQYQNGSFTTSDVIFSTLPEKLKEQSAIKEGKSLQSATNNYLKVTKNGEKLDYKTWADGNSGGEITQTSAKAFLELIGSEKSAEKYREQINSTAKFLWVDNIWIADSPLSHPVYSQLQNQSSGCFSSCNPSSKGYLSLVNASYSEIFNTTSDKADEYYQKLIRNLTEEQNKPNGYFILAILTAVVTLLSQLVMNKSQKAQMELQSVDGQGARTQKMMTWLMPILMVVFSFMYSSSFSIYMILSSAISIGTTFLINWIVDLRLKKIDIKTGDKATIIRGRVYEPKVEEKSVDNKKKKKKDEEEIADFMKSDAENRKINKHIRGRKK